MSEPTQHAIVANPLQTQIGGAHYKGLTMEPLEFWERNQLPATVGTILKHVTRHADKNGRQDLEKAGDYIGKLIWWTFDAPEEDRVTPAHWRDGWAWVVPHSRFSELNRLKALERCIIELVCTFSCRAHLEMARELVVQCIERDYAGPELDPLHAVNLRDVLLLCQTRLEDYLEDLVKRGNTALAQSQRVARLIRRVRIEWRRS